MVYTGITQVIFIRRIINKLNSYKICIETSIVEIKYLGQDWTWFQIFVFGTKIVVMKSTNLMGILDLLICQNLMQSLKFEYYYVL